MQVKINKRSVYAPIRYTMKEVQMTEAEFNALPEFEA